MSVEQSEDDLYALKAQITRQQSLVRQLKKDSAPAEQVAEQVATLLELRAKVSALEKKDDFYADFNRKAFDELMLRKMFIVPSFEIHNGPAGLFDYGPPACPLKANVLASWRQHFVVEESMLEMECTNLTPANVLATSGHVERFTDFMTRDAVTGECFRADKLLEDGIDVFLAAKGSDMMPDEVNAHRLIQVWCILSLLLIGCILIDYPFHLQRQAESFSAEELGEMLAKYEIKSPSNGTNDLTTPFPFNLMFR